MSTKLRVVVAGMGVQGAKRRKHAGEDFVASVDPVKEGVDYRRVEDVPLNEYDAVLACIPDAAKMDVLRHCLSSGKHVLVEKPLWTPADKDIEDLQALARSKGVVCYTAYNHRFEPHFVRMRDLIASGALGKIYSCRMFYGNGTARLVRDSVWRDKDGGVVPDLGSHLLDTCNFWFGTLPENFKIVAANRFENSAPDHAIVGTEVFKPRIELEMTLCMWRNHFTCDVLAEKGTAHIESLCKWGPSIFSHRTRVLPSGRPPEEQVTLVQDDPTWALEYAHFKNLIASNTSTDLSQDMWLQKTLRRLSAEAIQ